MYSSAAIFLRLTWNRVKDVTILVNSDCCFAECPPALEKKLTDFSNLLYIVIVSIDTIKMMIFCFVSFFVRLEIFHSR
jgi:hypothetical protein